MFPVHWYELRLDRPLLDPTTILEQTSLQLSCRIAGLHIEKFEWFKNGELIAVCHETPPSSLITTMITGQIDHGSFHASYDTLPAHFIALLTVDQTTKQRHEGIYECRASNAHYQVSSTCQVVIQQIEQELPSREQLTSQAAVETRKRLEDDRQEQVLSVESKRPRIDPILDERSLLSSQSLITSPVQSQFRTIGDQAVPSVDNKKVTWNEQIETYDEVNLRLIV